MIFLTKLLSAIIQHKRMTGLIVVALITVFGWIFLDMRDQSSEAMKASMRASMNEKEKKENETVTPKLHPNSNSVLLLGEVVSHESAHIYARRQGIVKDVYVDVGDTVYANQVVAVLLPRGVEGESAAAIAEQKARRDLAATQLEEAKDVEDDVVDAAEEKVDELKKKRDSAEDARDAAIAKARLAVDQATTDSERTSAQAELDRVEAVESAKVDAFDAEIDTAKDRTDAVEEQQESTIENAQASLSVANASLQKTQAINGHVQIRSPFAGVIAKRFVEVGESISSTMPSFRLADVPTTLAKKAKREIVFGLPENLERELSVGDEVVFFVAYDGEKEYRATVTRKSPEVDEQMREFIVHAKLDDSDALLHRTSVRVRLLTQEQPLYMVPSKSIKRIDDKNYIWVLKGDMMQAERLEVSVSADDGEMSDVTGNITEDTRILKRVTDALLQSTNMQEEEKEMMGVMDETGDASMMESMKKNDEDDTL